MAQRFQMHISPIWGPLLALFGGTAGRSFVEIDRTTLRAKFGWLFDHTFPLSDIQGAEERHWPWLYGLGWRTSVNGLKGLIGSYKNVVEIRFNSKHRVTMVIPGLRCNRLAVSLEKPQDFLEFLRQRGED